MSSQEEHLRKLVESIVIAHRDDQMDCDMCAGELDCLAEKVAAGADLRDLLPAVECHLACCKDCNEEFIALVCIIRAEMNGYLVPPTL